MRRPWGRATAVASELVGFGDAVYWPPSSSESDDGNDARPYDPASRWAAGARAYAALLPCARDALAVAESGVACGVGACRLVWALPPRGVHPCLGLRCAPRETVVGRVSLVTPTTECRRAWHGLVLANARRQTWRDIECVVYDEVFCPSLVTGPGAGFWAGAPRNQSAKAPAQAATPSPVLAAAEDVVYVKSP